MDVFDRICITDWEVTAENGDHYKVERGRHYKTSKEIDGEVVVFSGFWVRVPVEHFAGEMQIHGSKFVESEGK